MTQEDMGGLLPGVNVESPLAEILKQQRSGGMHLLTTNITQSCN